MAEPSGEVRHFRYAELQVATAGFAPQNRLGGGGFGEVFRGALPPGPPPDGGGERVAVKVIPSVELRPLLERRRCKKILKHHFNL